MKKLPRMQLRTWVSFRKLLPEFSIVKEILLISYQAWVRSYLKQSWGLIKHGEPEVITLIFFFFFFAIALIYLASLVGFSRGVVCTWGDFDDTGLIWSDKRGKCDRDGHFSLSLLSRCFYGFMFHCVPFWDLSLVSSHDSDCFTFARSLPV